ncbi:MAG: hypothetical protein NTU44_04515 [Bacteroidetes bacterium]|nr:hypothetical protein [Bacteroidota bacterium]
MKTTSKKSDSVDIFIRVMDNWSIIPIVIASSSRVNLRLTDKNFSGLGHEFQNGFTWYKSNGSVAFNTNYFIPNIRNTHITSTIHYGTDEYGNFLRNFAIDRPFFSPFAHWAAGVGFMQQFRKDTIRSPDSIFNPQRFKFNTQDYWAGNALPIFRGNTENSRTTNFISAIRFLRIRYLEGPSKIIDTLNIYSDENFYLVGIGISMRKYVQDKFIFKYGVTEDVPIGNVFSITAGYQDRIRNGRTYIGARISSGRYYSWGYLSSDIEYGTFFSASQAQQGVFLVSANYFTGLVEIGKWKFRQFVKPQLIIGINRFSYDSLTLNDGRGLDGFNSSLLSGSSRLLLTLQTQSYSPWDLIGFHFGPYLMCSLGMLGDERNGFKNKKAYAQLGLGVLIKNENLIISTFEISLAFYPVIPGNGHNVFKINSFKTTDFGFKDFEIGKPATIIFH